MLAEEHRRNGDLTKETKQFRQTVEALESRKRKPLAENNHPTKRDLLKSPVAMIASPIASRVLTFAASPITPKRL
jgi:hypothetical protein